MSAAPSINSLPYLRTASGAIAFRGERAGEVRIPNYVYDLWLPLLGTSAIGLYATYVRLARNRRIYGLSVGDIAKSCRMSKTTVGKLNQELQDCGFIKVDAPQGQQKYRHYTIEITVYDAPREVPPDIMRDYQHPQGYQPLSHWLVADAADGELVLDGNSQSTGIVEGAKNSTAMIASCIASSGSDQSSDPSNTTCIEKGGADAPSPKEVLDQKNEDGNLKGEQSKPELRILPTPAHSKQESNTPSPPSSAPPPKQPLETSRQAADAALTPVESALELLCYGTQFVAWSNGASRGEMRNALKSISDCDPERLTKARIEESGRWWFANDWRGRKGERPTPTELAKVWPRFVAGETNEPPKNATPSQPPPSEAVDQDDYSVDELTSRFQPTEEEIQRRARREAVPPGVRDVWVAQLGQLQVQLNRSTYNTWLGNAKLLDYERVDGVHVVYIEVPHRYAEDWLEKHLKQSMIENFEKLWKLSRLEAGKIDLVFEVAE